MAALLRCGPPAKPPGTFPNSNSQSEFNDRPEKPLVFPGDCICTFPLDPLIYGILTARNLRAPMKANITLKLDSSLLRQAKLLAAEQGTSVSGLLSSTLEELVLRRRNYDRAKRSALARLKTPSALEWNAPQSRDELHER